MIDDLEDYISPPLKTVETRLCYKNDGSHTLIQTDLLKRVCNYVNICINQTDLDTDFKTQMNNDYHSLLEAIKIQAERVRTV